MDGLQLDFDFGDQMDVQLSLRMMRAQIDAMQHSADKVRRNLFAQVGELKKICSHLKKENLELKCLIIDGIHGDDWEYKKGYDLFSLPQKTISILTA